MMGLAVASLAAAELKPVDEASYPQAIAGQRGKVVLVDFWATWCGGCVEEMPRIVGLEGKYRSRGLRLITVSCDEPEDAAKAQQFLQKNGVLSPAYIKRAKNDEKFINSVDPKWTGALPGLFLYDRGGRLVKAFIGETDMEALERAVREIL